MGRPVGADMAINSLVSVLRRSWLLVVLVALVTGLLVIRLQPGAPVRRPAQGSKTPRLMKDQLGSSPRNSIRRLTPAPSSKASPR